MGSEEGEGSTGQHMRQCSAWVAQTARCALAACWANLLQNAPSCACLPGGRQQVCHAAGHDSRGLGQELQQRVQVAHLRRGGNTRAH